MPTALRTPAPGHEPKRISPRLSPSALIQRAVAADGASARRALLIVELHRSDRLAALAQELLARAVLGEVAHRIESMLRPGDRYAVAAHDELWVLLDDVSNPALAELAGNTIRNSLGRPIQAPRAGRTETVAQLRPVVGGTWFAPAEVPGAMALLESANGTARRALAAEGQVLIESFVAAQDGIDRGQLESELRTALHSNELEVFFQPQVDLARNRCVGAEALVRWHRADGKPVSASLIASIAEERGLVGQLTQFVLNTSLRHLMTWSGQGVGIGISINMSSVTLSDAAYPSYVSQALSTWGIDPGRLTLELTESLIVKNERAAQSFMREIRDFGCRLSLDDFGTGYSSFAYLRKFPLDELKIDKSFVDNIVSDHNDLRIVNALVEVAHTFDLHALAEGVETPGAADALREAGCDFAQGYHYARPLPPFEFVEWVRRFNAQPVEVALAAE